MTQHTAHFIYDVHRYLRRLLEYQQLNVRRVYLVTHRKIITLIQADEVVPEPCSDCVALYQRVDQTIKAVVFVLDNVCCLHNAFRK